MTLGDALETLRRELEALREAIERTAAERDLYTAEEAARRLSISLSTVRVLIARGELRYLRVGSLVRVPRHSLEQFCRRNHFEVWGRKVSGKTRRPARMPLPPAARAARGSGEAAPAADEDAMQAISIGEEEANDWLARARGKTPGGRAGAAGQAGGAGNVPAARAAVAEKGSGRAKAAGSGGAGSGAEETGAPALAAAASGCGNQAVARNTTFDGLTR